MNIEGVSDVKCALVLPAAGSGQRVGSAVPKQFVRVAGRPLLFHTVRAFRCIKDQLTSIVIVFPENDKDESFERLVQAQLAKDLESDLAVKLVYIRGHHSRHRSIAEGVNRAAQDRPELIIIHDAVRPIVDRSLLEVLIKEAHIHGVAAPVIKLASTVIKVAEDGSNLELDSALVRSQHRASEMPQVLRTDLIVRAYNMCSNEDLDFGTECLDLVKRYCGAKVRIIEGDPEQLWKVTYRKDFITAADCLTRTNYQRSVKINFIGSSDQKLLKLMGDNLKCHFEEVLVSTEPICESQSPNSNITVEFIKYLNQISAVNSQPSLRVLVLGKDPITQCDRNEIFIRAQPTNLSTVIVMELKDCQSEEKMIKLSKWLEMTLVRPELSVLSGQLLFL